MGSGKETGTDTRIILSLPKKGVLLIKTAMVGEGVAGSILNLNAKKKRTKRKKKKDF